PVIYTLTLHDALPIFGATGAAFAVEVAGEERLVVVHELERGAKVEDLDTLVEPICAAVLEEHELKLYGLEIVRPGTVPKTSSGKDRKSTRLNSSHVKI